jgi:hypothetical protein
MRATSSIRPSLWVVLPLALVLNERNYSTDDDVLRPNIRATTPAKALVQPTLKAKLARMTSSVSSSGQGERSGRDECFSTPSALHLRRACCHGDNRPKRRAPRQPRR